MPMTWNADADAKLFAAVLKTCNVKLDYQALAAEMGPECTPKAITHRVANLRARAAGKGATDINTDTFSAPTTPKARKTATPKTPKSVAGTKRKGKAVKTEEDMDLDDADGVNIKSEHDVLRSSYKKPKVEDDYVDDGDMAYMG